MRFIRTRDPDLLVLRGTHLPTLIQGGFLLLVGACLLVAAVEGEEPISRAALHTHFALRFWLSVAVVFCGLLLLLWRHGIRMHRRERTVTVWHGVLMPFIRQQRTFAELRAVSLAQVDICDGVAWRVLLECTDTPVTLALPGSYTEARAVAERVATFLALPCADSSSGVLVVRDGATLGQSLRERVTAEGRVTAAPTAPPDLRLRVSRDSRSVCVDFPLPDVRRQAVLVVVVVALAFVITFSTLTALVWVYLPPRPAAVRLRIGWLLGGGLLLALPLLWCLRRWLAELRLEGIRLTVSAADGLRLETRSRAGLTVDSIPASEIEELLIIGVCQPDGALPAARGSARGASGPCHPPHILARSDKSTLALGAGLRPEELRFLHDLILHTLVS